MARQLRIEYPGAIYHTMARGDRKEPIVHTDGDRRAFLQTLGEMCQRTGIRLYAYALLNNHYHFVLTTPEGNLVKGMSWFQNTYTRRFNSFHHLWGHLFGDRYKSVLVEPGGNYFRKVIDYVNLNPVRAGLENLESGLGIYPWGSLKIFLGSPEGRPDWFIAQPVLATFGLDDTPEGRLAYKARLEGIVQREGTGQAGRVDSETTPAESLQSTIRRGWYFGSESFKEKMLTLIVRSPDYQRLSGADGYQGEQLRDHGETQARAIIQEGCKLFGTQLVELQSRKSNNEEKLLIAEAIASTTSVRLDWLRTEMALGSRSYASRLINQFRQKLSQDCELRSKRTQLLRNVNIQ